MHITFITHNQGKIKEAKLILEPEVTIDHIDYEYEEIQSDDPVTITKTAAKLMAQKLDKPVVVDDSGLFITALGGFPGTNSSLVHKQIGLQGILDLLKDKEDRQCFYKCAVGYCEPGEEPMAFVGQEEGTISKEIKGEHGFGHDPIFIPKGTDKTLGEVPDASAIKTFRREAFEQLREFLAKK